MPQQKYSLKLTGSNMLDHAVSEHGIWLKHGAKTRKSKGTPDYFIIIIKISAHSIYPRWGSRNQSGKMLLWCNKCLASVASSSVSTTKYFRIERLFLRTRGLPLSVICSCKSAESDRAVLMIRQYNQRLQVNPRKNWKLRMLRTDSSLERITIMPGVAAPWPWEVLWMEATLENTLLSKDP